MRSETCSFRRAGASLWKVAAVLSLILWASAGHAAASGTESISKEDRAVHDFFLAIQDYFRVPEPEIASLKEQGLSYDELPVVFFIAERSQAEVQRVMEMRLAGRTWTEVAFRLGLTPDVFYVPLSTAVTSVPYSHAYRGYSRKPKREWKTVSLTEKDVENLVNLRFLSDNYRCPPERVIEMRAAGKTFIQINESVRKSSGG